MPSERVGPLAVSKLAVAADRYRLALFGLLSICAGAALFFGARGYAPVVGMAGLLAFPLAMPARKDWIGFGMLGALIAWAAVSMQWSPAPNLHKLTSVKDLQSFTVLHLGAQLGVCGWLVAAAGDFRPSVALRALVWLGCGLLAGASLILIDRATHQAIYLGLAAAARQPVRSDLAIRNLAQSGDVVAVLAWPVGLALRRRGWPIAAFALAAFVPACMVLLRGFAPTLALLVSVPVYFCVLKAGRPALRVLLGLAAAYMVLTPWILLGLNRSGAFAAVGDYLPPSWAARTRIWSFASDRLLDHPLRGSGLDASRAFPHLIQLHPHDGPLQLWFELGVPGVLLGTAFWIWIFIRLGRRADNQCLFAALGAATACVYLTISAVGFGLWQEWWICVGALGLTCCVLAGKFADSQAGFSKTTIVT